MSKINISKYSWEGYPENWVRKNSNLNDCVIRILREIKESSGDSKVFELGCGNGSFTSQINKEGFDVTGVDPSPVAIQQAKQNHSSLSFYMGSSEEELALKYGTFSIVVSLEVIEHVFSPYDFVTCIYQLLEPGGRAIISTPFHGYWKNLAIALFGKFDQHFTALWEVGHIKFFSPKTLSTLLNKTGYDSKMYFHYVGRFRPFSKSMIVVATRQN